MSASMWFFLTEWLQDQVRLKLLSTNGASNQHICLSCHWLETGICATDLQEETILLVTGTVENGWIVFR